MAKTKFNINDGGLLTFPKSTFDQFRHTNNLRWGQAFYGFMRLDKCTQDKVFADRLYSASDEVAKAMVILRLGRNQ